MAQDSAYANPAQSAEEFARRGFAGGRMETIARLARVNKAMLHYHFQNKKELHAQVVRHLIQLEWEKDSDFLKIIEGLDPAQSLYVWLHALAFKHSRGRDPVLRRIIAWELAEGRGTVHEVYREYVIPRTLMVEDVIVRGIRAGMFQADDPLLIVWNMISFFVFYSLQRETYAGTELHRRLYKERGVPAMLDFMLECAAKQLHVAGGRLAPTLPEGADKYVQSVRCSMYKTSEGKK
ncbi:MAG: TetR/AcrR family transcriptional regulator [Spirochaetia bacterium]|nr:TetR/AcrR family transcriptional regulator [Spirochaetia bacterium]